MRIEDIAEQWSSDCVIDPMSVGDDSIKTAKLHSKYSTIWTAEKLRLLQLVKELKTLKGEKEEFFYNPTEEKVKAGWKIPAKGKLLKSEIPKYLEYDKDILELELKLGQQQEKIEFLKSIMSQIASRGYLIKNYLEDRRFLHGG